MQVQSEVIIGMFKFIVLSAIYTTNLNEYILVPEYATGIKW